MMNDKFAALRESQQDSGLQPRVATQELPWVMGEISSPNPNGVVARGDE